jgi:hypothetical protein
MPGLNGLRALARITRDFPRYIVAESLDLVRGPLCLLQSFPGAFHHRNMYSVA